MFEEELNDILRKLLYSAQNIISSVLYNASQQVMSELLLKIVIQTIGSLDSEDLHLELRP